MPAFTRPRDELRTALARERGASRRATDPAVTASAPRPDVLTHQSRVIVSLREQAAVEQQQLEQARAECRALSDDNTRLECVLRQLLDQREASNADHPTLCGRCVLVIGGQPQQCRHFRALVEASDGVFLHHDGGVEDKATRVAELVRRADAVVCPTEQVSHDAMKRAKRLCRTEAKPMIFLKRSSLAAFAGGLATLAKTPHVRELLATRPEPQQRR